MYRSQGFCQLRNACIYIFPPFFSRNYCKTTDIRHTKSQNIMILILSCSCLCPIQWNQVFSHEWRCSANRGFTIDDMSMSRLHSPMILCYVKGQCLIHIYACYISGWAGVPELRHSWRFQHSCEPRCGCRRQDWLHAAGENIYQGKGGGHLSSIKQMELFRLNPLIHGKNW